jgi:hypothetical protein
MTLVEQICDLSDICRHFDMNSSHRSDFESRKMEYVLDHRKRSLKPRSFSHNPLVSLSI